MKNYKYKFHFMLDNGKEDIDYEITYSSCYKSALILAQAERIKAGKQYENAPRWYILDDSSNTWKRGNKY